MVDQIENNLKINKSKIPLRWIANACGSIAGWAIMKISYQDELEDFGWRYKLHSTIWKITWPIYFKFGTFYEWNFDMSGDGWNDMMKMEYLIGKSQTLLMPMFGIMRTKQQAMHLGL